MFGIDQFSNNLDPSLFETQEIRISGSPKAFEELGLSSSLKTENSSSSWLTSTTTDANSLSYGVRDEFLNLANIGKDLSFFQKPDLSVEIEKGSIASSLHSESTKSSSP